MKITLILWGIAEAGIPTKRVEFEMEKEMPAPVAAAEVFSFGHPERREEWVAKVGPVRCMEVGDVIQVEAGGVTTSLICAGCGWALVGEGDLEKLAMAKGYMDRLLIADAAQRVS